MKKLITILFLAITLFTQLIPVSAAIKAPERSSNTSWVEDYANVLSTETEEYIQQYSQLLADNYSACIVVVTVDFVTGSISDYAISIFNQWKIGDSKLNNGVLLLLSIGDDDYYMMIGRGLENKFPIYDIQVLLDDYLEPSFARKDYDAGVRSVYQKTYEYMNTKIYTSTSTNNNNNNSNTRRSSNSSLYSFVGFIYLIIIFIIIIMMFRALRNRSSARYYQPTTYVTRPRYRTYRSPYSYRPSSFDSYDRYTPRSTTTRSRSTTSNRSTSSNWSTNSRSSGRSSSSSRSSGSGTSYGGSSRGAGAGRRH